MKTMIRSALSLAILFLIGCVAALFAGVGQVDESASLRFDPDPFVIPSLLDWSHGQTFEVTVANASDRPARIVGVENFCGAACFSGVDLPATIPPRGRGRLTIAVRTNRPGPISEKLNFFTDQPRTPKLTLRIDGLIPEGAICEDPNHPVDP